MKKFIAISAALALVAGSAFAEVSWSGGANFGLNLLQGGNNYGHTGFSDPPPPDRRDNNLVGGAIFGETWLEASFDAETGFGEFGGMFEVSVGGRTGAWGGATPTMLGRVWWRPMDMLRIGVGNELGFMQGGIGVTGPHRWGGQHVDGRVDQARLGGSVAMGRAFLGELGAGLSFEITPMDNLNIAIGLPYNRALGGDQFVAAAASPAETNPILVGNIFRGVFARAWFDLDGVGRIGFGYRDGSYGTVTWNALATEMGLPADIRDEWFADDGIIGGDTIDGLTITNPGRIHAYFRGNHLVPDLDFQFGVGFRLPRTLELEIEGESNFTASTAGELSIGLGVQYTIMPELQIRFNASAALLVGGEDAEPTAAQAGAGAFGIDTRADRQYNATRLAFELAPNFQATDDIGITFYAGFGIDIAGSNIGYVEGGENWTVDNRVWWAINPYVTLGITGRARFLVGVQVWGNNGSLNWEADGNNIPRHNAPMNWAVPIGLRLNF